MIVQTYIQTTHRITACSTNPHPHFVLSDVLCFASEVKIKCYLCVVFHFIDY